MATPHNNATKGDIAKVVLMPGDPLRAKYVADHYLTDVRLVNEVRNMFAFTGNYEGKEVTVMGSGMGMPSIGIYSWELFTEYDVEAIIRIGTAGGIDPKVKLRDIVIGQAACTDSNYVKSFMPTPGTFAPIGDFSLIRAAVEAAEELGATYHVGNLLSTDVFYSNPGVNESWAAAGVLACEMEAAALYTNAIRAGKKALGIMTISDLPMTGEGLPAEERQTSFTQMMEVALKTAKAQG